MSPPGNPGLNERIKTDAKHLENVIFNNTTLYVVYVQNVAKLAANFAVIIVMSMMSERDELGPSAPKAFNQSEEMLELTR